jgi:hypothetical protein
LPRNQKFKEKFINVKKEQKQVKVIRNKSGRELSNRRKQEKPTNNFRFEYEIK